MKGAIRFDIKNILIILLLGFFIYKIYFEKPKTDPNAKTPQKEKVDGKTYNVIKFEVDTVRINDIKVVEKTGEDFIYATIIHDTVTSYKDVDTAKILKDYFSSLVIIDSFQLKDSLGYVYVLDTINQNKLKHRKWTSDIKYDKIIITKYLTPEPKRELYAGFNGTIDKANIFNSIGGSLLYKDKKNKIFQLGGGLSNTNKSMIAPYLNGGVYWKISSKK